MVMLDFGFIVLLIGSILLIWLKLGARAETRALSPTTVLQRNSAVEIIKTSRKKGYREAYILIAVGIILIVIFGVMN